MWLSETLSFAWNITLKKKKKNTFLARKHRGESKCAVIKEQELLKTFDSRELMQYFIILLVIFS